MGFYQAVKLWFPEMHVATHSRSILPKAIEWYLHSWSEAGAVHGVAGDFGQRAQGQHPNSSLLGRCTITWLHH